MSSRQRMIRSMSKILQKKEISMITVQNIIDDADVSRGTFYSYFSDKYDLMNTYFRDETKKHMETFYDKPWVTILTQGAAFMKQNRSYFLEAFKSTGQNSFCKFWFDDALTNVEKGIKLRSGRIKISIKEEQAAQFFVAGYIRLMIDWIEQDTPTTPEHIARVICDFMPVIIQKILW